MKLNLLFLPAARAPSFAVSFSLILYPRIWVSRQKLDRPLNDHREARYEVPDTGGQPFDNDADQAYIREKFVRGSKRI